MALTLPFSGPPVGSAVAVLTDRGELVSSDSPLLPCQLLAAVPLLNREASASGLCRSALLPSGSGVDYQ